MPDLSNDDWNRLATLLDAVLDHPPEERTAFLADACANAPHLRDELEGLLDCEDEASAFFADGPAQLSPTLTHLNDVFLDAVFAPQADAESLVGTHVGPYRVTDNIGEGGMGRVYRAERADGTFGQEVALKVLRHGLDNASMKRFVAERHMLAPLTHPNIARLLDGGVTPDGRPFMVMEYVEGTTLEAYCRDHRLSIKDRVALMLDVCDAVHYAHTRLIVHRDLKPSNILVTGDGTVKLLDFGIAKALEGSEAVDMVRTQTGRLVVTPAYAAPEQLTGGDITTATDVYALGVVLYSLLVGHRPYASVPYDRPLHQWAQERPPPPLLEEAVDTYYDSTARQAGAKERGVTVEQWTATLRGDVSTVLQTALQAHPEDRYDGADALAQDLRRYLDDRPIKARPPTLRYRVRKFIARNPTLVTSTTLAVLALLVGLGVALWQADVAAQERDRARLEAQKAEQVAAFMRDLFRSNDPATTLGDSVSAATLLRRGWKDAPSELDGQPRLQQSMLAEIADIMVGMGTYARADSVLSDAFALHDSTASPTATYGQLLYVQGKVRDLQGDYAAAERLHREALSVRRAVHGASHPDVGRSLNQLASMLTYRGDYAAAAPLYAQAVSMLRRTLGPEHEEVTGVMHNYAWMRRSQGHLEAADSLYQRAYRLALRTLPSNHPEILMTLNGLALTRKQRGDLVGADTLYRQVLAEQQRILGPVHPNVGITHSNLGLLLQKRERLASASEHVQKALTVWRSTLGPNHPYVAVGLSNLGIIERDRGHFQAAETAFRDALALHRRVLPEGHVRIASTLVGLGRLFLMQDRPTDALPYLEDGHRIRASNYVAEHPARAESGVALATCWRALGRTADARRLFATVQEAACRPEASMERICMEAESALAALQADPAS